MRWTAFLLLARLSPCFCVYNSLLIIFNAFIASIKQISFLPFILTFMTAILTRCVHSARSQRIIAKTKSFRKNGNLLSGRRRALVSSLNELL